MFFGSDGVGDLRKSAACPLTKCCERTLPSIELFGLAIPARGRSLTFYGTDGNIGLCSPNRSRRDISSEEPAGAAGIAVIPEDGERQIMEIQFISPEKVVTSILSLTLGPALPSQTGKFGRQRRG
jgi:hypothetical protein